MVVFAVVSIEAPEEAFELFVRREDAERFLEDVRNDDPALAERLSVETVELDT